MNTTKEPLKIEYIKISKLKNWNKNPRKNDPAVEKLSKLLETYGFISPIIATKDNIIRAGHTRLKAAKKLNMETVPVVYIDMVEDMAAAYALADNKSNEWSEWDNELLGNVFKELKEHDFDLQLTGFDLPEIGSLLNDITEAEPKEDNFDIDAELEKKKEPFSQLGDLWLLCNHRLLCGDSTSADDVDRLMGGKRIDMAFTDPPYGIDVVENQKACLDQPFGSQKYNIGTIGGSNIVKANLYPKIKGDNTTETAKKFYLLCKGLGCNNYLLWGGNYFTDFLPPSRCWLIWDKKGRKWDDNFSDFEIAYTSFDKPCKIITHVFMGMVQSGEREIRVHPTQKPINLIIECFNYLGEFKNIYDGFGGSGSTLIACEQLKRNCYMMELEPLYIDVIVKRYIQFTGNKDIKLIRNNETIDFKDIEKEFYNE